MKTPLPRFIPLLAAGLLLAACGGKDAERKVWFGNLSEGQELTSPFTVEMKAQNLVVEPAANGVTEGHGHFHIIVNSPLPNPPGPIPLDDQHIHYGAGDTTTTLDLPPGDHTLTLQFATGDHVPYTPQITQTVRVTVTAQVLSTPSGTGELVDHPPIEIAPTPAP